MDRYYKTPSVATTDVGAAYRFDMPSNKIKARSSWSPRHWSTRTWLGVGVAGLAVIAGIVVGVVITVRNNAYPAYKRLTYALEDNCKSYVIVEWTILLME